MTKQTEVEAKKPLRAPVREGEVKLRPGEYRGRNNELLRRSPVKNGNPFDIPDDIKEDGWSLQWIRHSCYNNTDYSELAAMKRAGWREVSPDALKGYFRDEVPEGQSSIIKEGLVLVERPEQMTKDAEADALKLANSHYERQLQKIYDENFQLPDGFVPTAQLDRENLQAAPNAWKPAHRPRPVDAED